MQDRRCEITSGFPPLPEDLYSDIYQSSQLASSNRKHTRSTFYHSPTLADRELFKQHPQRELLGQLSQPDVHQCAAIAAFRPEEFPSASSQQGLWHPRHSHLAPADLDPFRSDTDGGCCTAALAACAANVTSQQQASGVVALPFPGMHTLDLSFPFAQPALLEAGQQLLERPQEFQAALTRSPLSQVNTQASCNFSTPS